MELELKFLDVNELRASDEASYSLGWIEIKSRAFEVAFFKDKYCMVIITYTQLIGHLTNMKETPCEFDWSGIGYGASISVRAEQNKIFFSNKEFIFTADLNSFIKTIQKCSDEFINSMIKENSLIQNDNGFQDLILATKKFYVKYPQ